MWRTNPATRSVDISMIEEEVLDAVRKKETWGSVQAVPSQTSTNTEPTHLRQRAGTWVKERKAVTCCCFIIWQVLYTTSKQKLNCVLIWNPTEIKMITVKTDTSAFQHTSLLQCISHCSVCCRQIQWGFTLCVSATPISPKVQQKVHHTCFPSSDRSM